MDKEKQRDVDMHDEDSHTDQKTDSEIIDNLDLLMNMDVLEETDYWDELSDAVDEEEQGNKPPAS